MFNDYEDFKKEFKRYEDHDWDSVYHEDVPKKTGEELLKIVEGYGKAADIKHLYDQTDMVNSPAHYTRGTQEAIDIIEEVIQDAPDPVTGALQYQVLKYVLRLWLKENPLRDAKKAQWYLNRLILKLEKDN